MKNRLLTLMLPLCAWATTASCSQSAPHGNSMTLKIRTPKEFFYLHCSPDSSIGDLKETIATVPIVADESFTKAESQPICYQRLSHGGVRLKDHFTCGRHGLRDGCELSLRIVLDPLSRAEKQTDEAERRIDIQDNIGDALPLLPPVLLTLVTEYSPSTHPEFEDSFPKPLNPNIIVYPIISAQQQAESMQKRRDAIRDTDLSNHLPIVSRRRILDIITGYLGHNNEN